MENRPFFPPNSEGKVDKSKDEFTVLISHNDEKSPESLFDKLQFRYVWDKLFGDITEELMVSEDNNKNLGPKSAEVTQHTEHHEKFFEKSHELKDSTTFYQGAVSVGKVIENSAAKKSHVHDSRPPLVNQINIGDSNKRTSRAVIGLSLYTKAVIVGLWLAGFIIIIGAVVYLFTVK